MFQKATKHDNWTVYCVRAIISKVALLQSVEKLQANQFQLKEKS